MQYGFRENRCDHKQDTRQSDSQIITRDTRHVRNTEYGIRDTGYEI